MPDYDQIGEDLERIQDILDDASSSGNLTEWEYGFVDDFRSRVMLYGERTRITDKVRDVIDRIERKIHAAE